MFRSVTLEVSLKPFWQTEPDSVRAVCAQIFDQWRPLLKGREEISIMMWVSDGSELLDYAGRMEDEFEWCRFIGTANLPPLGEGEPRETSLHRRRQDYMPNAPHMTYGILKMIVATLKDECRKAFPMARCTVGETFDIGPEFAISDFKYRRHREICTGTVLDHCGFVDATATLHADDRCYAAYPNGIPEGEKFGTFLGKQSKYFLNDMGFDYLWPSNGLGFSADPWNKTGKIFDGEHYFPEKLADTKQKVFDFWKSFREACPDVPLRTRGTNNSVGIDYASDGVPLYDIYHAGLDITAPPNSPWAALDDNFGLEMMGHMTRICELPNDAFPFRYYLHDPWWVNSPWYDRYDGTPCDIYLPMAISRVTGDGKVHSANTLNILSIDNSYGGMPDACVNEPLPHLLKAEKDAADETAPLVWVYPMHEYTTSDSAALLKEMNEGDHYICGAINDGVPLCCVVSTDNFLQLNAAALAKSILISPVPVREEVAAQLRNMARAGVPVIIYGTSEALRTVNASDNAGMRMLNIAAGVSRLREEIGSLGYEIDFEHRGGSSKVPTMALARSDGALWLSAYNVNTTTAVRLKFPLGAPLLCGMETEIVNGSAIYHFARSEHRECRAFVKQDSGVISCREMPPVNARFRRNIRLAGLRDATIRIFSETGCECALSTADPNDSPKFYTGVKTVNDERLGTYLEAEHLNGDIYILIGRVGTA